MYQEVGCALEHSQQRVFVIMELTAQRGIQTPEQINASTMAVTTWKIQTTISVIPLKEHDMSSLCK